MLIFQLVFGLTLVVIGADILINSSISIGKKYKVSELIIGIIVIGFGTSLCELIVSIDSVLKNAAELSIGNVIGSNVANIFLVIGISGLIKRIKIPKISKFDNSFHFFSSFLFFLIFILDDFNKFFGIIFICLFFFYLYQVLKNSESNDFDESGENNDFFSRKVFQKPIVFGFPIIVLSISLTVFGADLTVLSAIKISKIFGMSESVIGLSLIAIGTSLPEIAAGITATRKMRFNLIFGNIIGSNLYNLLLILGISSLFPTFNYISSNLTFDVFFLGFSTVIFSLLILFKKIITIRDSVIMLSLYFLYMFHLCYKNLYV